MKQRQFLDVVSDERAHEILEQVFGQLSPSPESVPLAQALGRALLAPLHAEVNVPGFDRSNMDGFALRAVDSFGATETEARVLRLRPDAAIAAGARDSGDDPQLQAGECVEIATGGVVPRGADAVIMVEDSAPSARAGHVDIFRSVTPGTNISGAGSDIGQGEIVLQAGQRLSSRETALAAAVGADTLLCARQPRALVLSTGDEIRAPGSTLALGEVFDSNSRILCDALTESGALVAFGGILPDDEELLLARLRTALESDQAPDLILLSGGTSKGRGDLNSRVLQRLAELIEGSRGIVLHGVALKPGKPICIAEIAGRPIAVLPGFPTSAIFTFHEFVSPLLARLSGTSRQHRIGVSARMPHQVRSVAGRTEYMLVDLVPGPDSLVAYPLGAGSGSVSTFSRADGYIRVPRQVEFLERAEPVEVYSIGAQPKAADLFAIGSHCVGLELLLGQLTQQGFSCKSIPVGSTAGLRALERGEGDLAGCHLLDPETDVYNRSFLPPHTTSIGGYGRRQGIVFRPGDERFAGRTLDELKEVVQADSARMINRNRGSGTRVLLDQLLDGACPPGFTSEAKSHHAVAAAVAQGRADWGLTLDGLARAHGLEFLFLRLEEFELIVPKARLQRPSIKALQQLLGELDIQAKLSALGFNVLRPSMP